MAAAADREVAVISGTAAPATGISSKVSRIQYSSPFAPSTSFDLNSIHQHWCHSMLLTCVCGEVAACRCLPIDANPAQSCSRPAKGLFDSASPCRLISSRLLQRHGISIHEALSSAASPIEAPLDLGSQETPSPCPAVSAR